MPKGYLTNRIWKSVGAIPLVLFIILLANPNSLGSVNVHEMPVLLAFLNSIFLCAIPLIIAFQAAKSHHATGSLSFMILGCGLVFFGYSSLLAGWVMPMSGGPNSTVTLHNLGSLFAAFCQVAGAHYALREIVMPQETKNRVKNCSILFAAIVLAISFIAAITFYGFLPPFFNQATGPTILRQFVLGGAICLFALAGFIFLEIHSTTRSGFAYWYGQALWLIAIGLVYVFLQHKVGGALGWIGRASQYVGCVYFILAFFSGRRDMALPENKQIGNSAWNLWPYLEQKIEERTSELTRLNEVLLHEIDERKEAEELLTRLVHEFNIILENAPIGISKIIDRKQVLVNRKNVELFQYSKEEVEFQTTRKLYPSDEAYEKLGQEAYPILAQGLVFETVQNLIRKDGAHVLVRYIGKAIDPPDMSKGTIWMLEDVTVQKQAEEIILDSEKRYRNLMENVPAIIYEYSMNHGGLFYSPQVEQVFGYPLQDFYDNPLLWKNSIHPDDVALVENAILIARVEGTQGFDIEYRVRTRSGTWIWLNDNIIRREIQDEDVIMYGIAQNITERKLALEALRLSEQQLLTSQEISKTGSWTYDLETGRIWGSAVGLRIFGYPPVARDFPIDDIEACIPERERVHQALGDLINEGREYNIEFAINPADGSPPKVILSIAKLEKDAVGNPLKIIGFVQDIT